MSCQKVQEQIALMLDRQLVSAEWEQSLAHIQACRRCDAHLEAMRNMQAELHGMAHVSVPAGLTAGLRVLASHEHARHELRATLSTRLRNFTSNVHLCFDNLLRPFAVPVTGGLFTALLMFSILVPTLNPFQRSTAYEPPLAVLTDPEGTIVGANKEALRLQPGSATITGNEVSLVLLVDERGYIQDCYLSGGELTDEMKNLILFSRFTPATIDGQPTWGLKQVVFQPTEHPRLRS